MSTPSAIIASALKKQNIKVKKRKKTDKEETDDEDTPEERADKHDNKFGSLGTQLRKGNSKSFKNSHINFSELGIIQLKLLFNYFIIIIFYRTKV